MMKYIGIIIVYSILLGGFDFFVFSFLVYCYIVIGDVDIVMDILNYGDCLEFVKNFIDKVLYMYLCLYINDNVVLFFFFLSCLFCK